MCGCFWRLFDVSRPSAGPHPAPVRENHRRKPQPCVIEHGGCRVVHRLTALHLLTVCYAQNTDLFWKPTLGCLADPATFLIDLAAATGSCVERFAAHAASLKSSQFKKEEANNTMSKQAAFGRNGKQLINPLALCREIGAWGRFLSFRFH